MANACDSGSVVERHYFVNEAAGTCCGGSSQARYTSGFATTLQPDSESVRRLMFDGPAAIVGFTARGVANDAGGLDALAYSLMVKITAGSETITDTSFDSGAGDGFVPADAIDLLVRRSPLVLERGQKLEIVVRNRFSPLDVTAFIGVIWARLPG